MEPADEKLDALLRHAAPDGVPPGFADRVVAAARSHRRRRRLRRAVLGIAALLALGLALRAYLAPEPSQRPAPRTHAARPAAAADQPESFAVQFVSTGENPQRVMMAKINGTYVISARPNDEMADELEELLRLPAAMAGSMSSAPGGAAMAVVLK